MTSEETTNEKLDTIIGLLQEIKEAMTAHHTPDSLAMEHLKQLRRLLEEAHSRTGNTLHCQDFTHNINI